MRVENGKQYWTRMGFKTGKMEPLGSNFRSWVYGSLRVWEPDGKHMMGDERYNLVNEAPLDD